MTDSLQSRRLISHTFNNKDIEGTVAEIKAHIQQQGDKPHTTVEQQLDILNQLAQFDFGKFLLLNRGINAYWTHYMLTHPWFGRKTGKNNRGEPQAELEKFLLDSAPLLLATQQRFEIFLAENQKSVKNRASLACIPGGMLGELLYLEFDGIDTIELYGIDYDPVAAEDAKALAAERRLTKFVHTQQKDAWKLEIENEFDLISSNGLNIYEPDDEKVTELYRQFYLALKPSGRLVTSAMTWPPGMGQECEWDMSVIDQEALLLSRIIFADVLQAKFQCYRSSEKTKSQLAEAGFQSVQVIADQANMFPTFVATKP